MCYNCIDGGDDILVAVVQNGYSYYCYSCNKELLTRADIIICSECEIMGNSVGIPNGMCYVCNLRYNKLAETEQKSRRFHG
jgi:hypothetical protein